MVPTSFGGPHDSKLNPRYGNVTTESMTENLTSRSLRALNWSYLSTVVNAVMQTGFTAVLARLLNPEAYGLIAMAGLVLSLGSYFAHMGIGSALIQKDELTAEDIRAAFTSSVFFGLIFSGLAFWLAPLGLYVFDQPAVIPVIQVLGIFRLIAVVPPPLPDRQVPTASAPAHDPEDNQSQAEHRQGQEQCRVPTPRKKIVQPPAVGNSLSPTIIPIVASVSRQPLQVRLEGPQRVLPRIFLRQRRQIPVVRSRCQKEAGSTLGTRSHGVSPLGVRTPWQVG